jgi:hypothetical protein
MQKKFVLIVSVILCFVAFVACDQLVWKDALFVAYNISYDEIEVLVNGVGVAFIPPNESVRFVTSVPVPRSRGSTFSPSSNDRRVRVTVAFHNLTTNGLTAPITCTAGARVVTHVWYKISSRGHESTRCKTS